MKGLKIAGVVGWPIAHSLSPHLHGYWLRELKIDGVYLPLPVARDGFSSALSALRALGLAGVNVTLPHKEAAFALAHEVDDAARQTGAVNLLLFRDDRCIGRNTDVTGLEASLVQGLGQEYLRGKTAVILGAGGAARAAVQACERMGVSVIRLMNRHEGRAKALATAVRAQAKLEVFGWNHWAQAAAGANLLINATMAGMKGAEALELSLDALPQGSAVCDLVYNPLETALLKSARARGDVTLDGLGMLMHQAAPAFEAFYGARPKVTDAVRRHLEKVLTGGG